MPVGTQMYSLDTLLWALFAGVTIAVIYTTCMKAALGGFVRALIDAAAVDPLTAKSAEELGFGGKKAVIRSLRPGGSLGRCLGRHPEDETKFFIPRGNTALSLGDKLLVMSDNPDELKKVYRKLGVSKFNFL